jgi:hypothetical protein
VSDVCVTEKREFQLLLIGLDQAGKTSLLERTKYIYNRTKSSDFPLDLTLRKVCLSVSLPVYMFIYMKYTMRPHARTHTHIVGGAGKSNTTKALDYRGETISQMFVCVVCVCAGSTDSRAKYREASYQEIFRPHLGSRGSGVSGLCEACVLCVCVCVFVCVCVLYREVRCVWCV